MRRMPVLFVGHGSPMNAIENNTFTEGWKNIASLMPKPEAILSVSAHWFTDGTRITDAEHPRMIHDMYGFPDELYRLKYDAPGAPAIAHEAAELISGDISIDNDWGIDHGTWSVLLRMYPNADIPVFQLSVDENSDAARHMEIGRELKELRDRGVLILGSGNVVHNLAKIAWNKNSGFPWADEFDDYIRDAIEKRDFDKVIRYREAGESAAQSFYFPDHFYPLLYVLGASDPADELKIFNNARTMGSMSMTSYLFG